MGPQPGRAAAGGPPRATRRQWLRAGALGAGAVAGGALLAGCRQQAQRAAPGGNQPVVELTFMPWWTDWDATGRSLLAQQCATFSAAHPGVRLTALPGPNGGGADGSAVLTALLSGQGPDLVCDYQDRWPQYLQGGAFQRLDPYIQRDGLDQSVWSAAHLAALRTADGQFALPTYDGPIVYAYRKDLLAALGLDPPDPDWTYTQAAALWRQCAGRLQSGGSSLPRYGATLWWWSDQWNYSNWLLVGFGGAEMDQSGTRALFSSPGSVQGGEWLMPLLWEGVVGFFGPGLETGQTVFSARGGWAVASDVATYGNAFPWDYAPAPIFPSGRATFGNADYWGLNALSRNLEPAWEVLKWLAYTPDWQRFCMKTALLPPCTAALWDEWEQTMVQTAPVLKGKALQWYRDAAQGGYGYAPQFFRYQAAQADRVITEQIVLLNQRQTDVPTAFAAISTQVDALQAAGAAQDASEAATVAAVRRLAGSTAPVPLDPPALTGAGQPASPGSALVTSVGGTYAVVGAGGDVSGQSDNATFACLPSNLSIQQFTCRVSVLANVNCPQLAPWAKVGLLARGDLSDNAPMAFVAVTGANGVETSVRFAAGYDPSVQYGGAAGPAAGLIGARHLTADNTRPAANYLLSPVWLRLSRQGGVWSAATSPDGAAWTPAGEPTLALMAGVWIGLFVSAVNDDFPSGAGLQIRATFDRLSFTPAAAYRLGAP